MQVMKPQQDQEKCEGQHQETPSDHTKKKKIENKQKLTKACCLKMV